ncbi:MAG: SUMF1/EgtB/PvdO family nonheme iron enzyme [bacterium]
MKNKNWWLKMLVILCILIGCRLPSATAAVHIDVDMRLNDGGFISYDHFRAELYMNNFDQMTPGAAIFGILEVFGEFYFWPSFTTEVDFDMKDIESGESVVVFLEFDFENIDEFIPFGPMRFWGAWFLDMETWNYDFQEFWLDSAHKWTPTPSPTHTPTGSIPTYTPIPSPTDAPTGSTPSHTPTHLPTDTPTNTSIPTNTSTQTPMPTDTSTPTDTPTPALTPTATPTNTPTSVPFFPGDLHSIESIVGNMRLVPAGSLMQGSPAGESCRGTDEGQFYHVLTQDIAVMETEISRRMWADLKAVQPALPNDPSNGSVSPTLDHPVQNVMWFEALLFANLLSKEGGYRRCYYTDDTLQTPIDETNYLTGPYFQDTEANGYRLPLEGEWEFFGRAGTTGAFSCDEPQYNSSNCADCTQGTHPTLEQYCVYCATPDGPFSIGAKLPNPWGLKDVHGNVWEWCWDRYGAYPSWPETDYDGPLYGLYRVRRGGSYNDGADHCRSAHRGNASPDFRYSDLGFRLVRTVTGSPAVILQTIDPAQFEMGSLKNEPCRGADETKHDVRLTRKIDVMTTEVTRGMWMNLQFAQPSLPDDPSIVGLSPTMKHPVQMVRWDQALLFANLLSLEYGLKVCYFKDQAFKIPLDATNYDVGPSYCNFRAYGFRLPTEAEWEFACRAQSTGAFSCNEQNYNAWNCNVCAPGTHPTLELHCSYCANKNGFEHSVAASKNPNQFGLYDMHGNVAEWCWDWYGSYPSSSEVDPTGPATGDKRVIRGGSWLAKDCRSAARDKGEDNVGSNFVGFRLVRTNDPGAPPPTATPTPMPTLTPTPTPTSEPFAPGSLHAIDKIVGNMRFVPYGSFEQGSKNWDPCHGGDEYGFTHTLSYIAVMETEVTRGMWADLKNLSSALPDDPSREDISPHLDYPVQNMTWYEAVLFANLLSRRNGFKPCYYKDSSFTNPVYYYTTGPIFCDFSAEGYRLPTEGEWEYFCRAGTTTPFSCDETNYNSSNCQVCDPGTLPILEHFCVYCKSISETTSPVGSLGSNPWNLKDVHGNVKEYCWDWYGDYPTGNETNYTGPSSGTEKVGRGGSFISKANNCRSAARQKFIPENRDYELGFRLVRKIMPSAVIEFAGISSGTFMMGSPPTEACREIDETQHSVTITQPFWMMATEVTRRMWADLKVTQPSLPDDPSFPYGTTTEHPVCGVQWVDAILFANLLSVQYGFTPCYYRDENFTIPVDATNYFTHTPPFCNFDADGFRLPTEAEWELACRAETTGTFWIDEPAYNSSNCESCDPGILTELETCCVFCANSPLIGHSKPVASKTHNNYDLYDTHGNVAEWCWDFYGEYPTDPVTDPVGAAIGISRVLRGGSWLEGAKKCRSAARDNKGSLGYSSSSVGFRLVKR